MSYRQLALDFDREQDPVNAAWAYEIALQQPDADLELCLNLVALYLASSDGGYMAHHRLADGFVRASLDRAREVLDAAERRFGPHAEIGFWRLYLREQVLYEDVPDSEYEALARLGGSLMPHYRLYTGSGGTRSRDQVRALWAQVQDGRTERQRYVRSVLQSAALPPLAP